MCSCMSEVKVKLENRYFAIAVICYVLVFLLLSFMKQAYILIWMVHGQRGGDAGQIFSLSR